MTRSVGIALALLGSLTCLVACGGQVDEECERWRPRGDAFTSLATARPPVLTSPGASADGRYVYAVGSWLEDGAAASSVFRSSDLGMSWCPLSPLPEPPTRVFSSGEGTLYAESTDSFPYAMTLQKSTDDGATWEVAASPGIEGSHLVVSPLDPSVVWSISTTATPRLAVSTNAMDTWREVELPPAVSAPETDFPVTIEAVVDPAAPARLLLLVHTYAAPSGPSSIVNRFFVTDDAGSTWTETFPIDAPNSVESFMSAVVDVASSVFLSAGETILASRDFGATWRSVGALPAGARIIDLHASTPDRLFASSASEAGVELWQSLDGGESWDAIPTPPAFEPWAAPTEDPDVLMGLSGPSVVATHNAGTDWQNDPPVPRPTALVGAQEAPFTLWALPDAHCSADGGLSWGAAMPSPGRVVPIGAEKALFVAHGSAEMQRTDDAGKTWTRIELDDGLTEFHGAASCVPPATCVYAFYGDPSSPYGTTLLRSDDGGKTWSAGTPIRPQLIYYPESLQVAPDDDRHLAGSGGEGFVQSRDGGKTWTTQALDTGSVALLGGGIILVSSTGRGTDMVTLRSEDNGTSWTEVQPFAGTLFTSPRQPDSVYLLAGGVYRSQDRGVSWERWSPEDVPYTIYSIADGPDGLVATTYEYGLVTLGE